MPALGSKEPGKRADSIPVYVMRARFLSEKVHWKLHSVIDANTGPAVLCPGILKLNCPSISKLPKPRSRISWLNIIATET